MKYLTAYIILFVIALQNIHAQQMPSSKMVVNKDYKYYMKKRNTSNTIGWVCLGAGVTMDIIGAAEGFSDVLNIRYEAKNVKGTGLVVAGTIVAVASVPFFINAHHNKKKASLALKNGSIMINNHMLNKSNYTAIAFDIKF